MKKKYFKPQVQSEDMFEQTANATGFNLVYDCTHGYGTLKECRINNFIDVSGDVDRIREVVDSEKS